MLNHKFLLIDREENQWCWSHGGKQVKEFAQSSAFTLSCTLAKLLSVVCSSAHRGRAHAFWKLWSSVAPQRPGRTRLASQDLYCYEMWFKCFKVTPGLRAFTFDCEVNWGLELQCICELHLRAQDEHESMRKVAKVPKRILPRSLWGWAEFTKSSQMRAQSLNPLSEKMEFSTNVFALTGGLSL